MGENYENGIKEDVTRGKVNHMKKLVWSTQNGLMPFKLCWEKFGEFCSLNARLSFCFSSCFLAVAPGLSLYLHQSS